MSVTVTVPERLLSRLDRTQRALSRSRKVTEALRQWLSNGGESGNASKNSR